MACRLHQRSCAFEERSGLPPLFGEPVPMKRKQSPSFAGLTPASRASSRAKQANRSKDTTAERLLRSALWRLGLRFRKNLRSLPGKPDVVFIRQRVAVFCDGDFWHGRNWTRLRRNLARGANAQYWTAKIASNIARDRTNDQKLQARGWQVVHLWETDVLNDPTRAASIVKDIVSARRTQRTVKRTHGCDS